MDIPKLPEQKRPNGFMKADERVSANDLVVVPVKDRYVLAYLEKIGRPWICSWGDFIVSIPPFIGFAIRRDQIRKEAGILVGQSFSSIQDAKVKLTPFRIQ